MSGILATGSIRDFFETALREALEQERIDTDEVIAVYLVDLLCEYIARCPQAEAAERSLTQTVARADHAAPSERVEQLKQIGDHALYTASFFGEAMRRQRLDIDYYNTVGGAAYQQLSQMLRAFGTESTQAIWVFAELSAEFRQYVHLLTAVRGQTTGAAGDLGATYETWLNTKSPAAEKRLQESGLMRLPTGPVPALRRN